MKIRSTFKLNTLYMIYAFSLESATNVSLRVHDIVILT